jgi:hypothetical protein
VLEHARAGDAALLGDVADEEDGGAGFLGETPSFAALSRTWLTEPGAAVSSSDHRVWMESAIISRGLACAACARMRSTQVSASACTPSMPRPRRWARPATCERLSSPVT